MERINTTVRCPRCGTRMESVWRGDRELFACQNDPCRWAGMVVTFEEATGEHELTDAAPPLTSPTAEDHERIKRQWAEAGERLGYYPL